MRPSYCAPLLLACLSATPLAGGEPPLCFVEEDQAVEGVGAAGGLGISVALDGGLAALGRPYDSTPFVAIWQDQGSDWASVDTVSAGDGGSVQREFGYSVALDGATMVVGAPADAHAGTDSGAAYVFVFVSGLGWVQEAKLTALSTAAGDRFGEWVDVSGDRVAIGAPRHDGLSDDSGSVYVFDRSGSTWSETIQLTPFSADEDAVAGTCLDLEGDLLLVGSPNAAGGGAGAIYRATLGVWALEDTLPPNGTPLSFAYRVALSGDTALLGSVTGPAHVFRESGGSWSLEDELAEADEVALDGDTALLARTGCAPGREVFAYTREGSTWQERGGLSLPQAWQQALALDGDRALVSNITTQFCSFDPVVRFLQVEEPRGTVAFRNGGTNPSVYSSTPGGLGDTIDMTIDLTGTGYLQALVIGFDSPFGITLGGGQTLLCLDLMGGGELINTGFALGPIVQHQVVVPDNTDLVGFEVYTQALLAFGQAPFALTNAQDLVIAVCP